LDERIKGLSWEVIEHRHEMEGHLLHEIEKILHDIGVCFHAFAAQRIQRRLQQNAHDVVHDRQHLT